MAREENYTKRFRRILPEDRYDVTTAGDGVGDLLASSPAMMPVLALVQRAPPPGGAVSHRSAGAAAGDRRHRTAGSRGDGDLATPARSRRRAPRRG